LNVIHEPTVAFPTVAKALGSAAGAVAHVTFSGHVCEATRETEPPTGDALVTNRRSVAAVTTSVPTPETVNRRSECWIGELSAPMVVVVP
jgi:hypothetical protein